MVAKAFARDVPFRAVPICSNNRAVPNKSVPFRSTNKPFQKEPFRSVPEIIRSKTKRSVLFRYIKPMLLGHNQHALLDNGVDKNKNYAPGS